MKSARDILPGVYRDGKADAEREFDLVVSYWTAAVGRRVAAHARPVYFGRGRLTVEVDDAVWLKQLETLAPQIRMRLNQELGGPTIAFILFRTDGMRGFGPGRAETSQPSPARGAHEIRNPMRRRVYLDSKKAAGDR